MLALEKFATPGSLVLGPVTQATGVSCVKKQQTVEIFASTSVRLFGNRWYKILKAVYSRRDNTHCRKFI